jgi:hypothetical protein
MDLFHLRFPPRRSAAWVQHRLADCRSVGAGAPVWRLAVFRFMLVTAAAGAFAHLISYRGAMVR